MASENFNNMMKKEPGCSRNLPKTRNVKGLENKSRAIKIARTILDLGSGKNLILRSLNNTKQRLECSVGESRCCSVKTLVQNYGNFRKSGAPSRLMFYHNGLWRDFPESVFGSMRDGFMARKTAIEVVMEGLLYLIDFLRMLMIDLEEGRHRSIAWIDENGFRFFPKFVEGGSEIDREVSANPKLDIELTIGNANGFGEKSDANLDPELRIAVEIKSNDSIVKKVNLEKIEKGDFFDHHVDSIKENLGVEVRSNDTIIKKVKLEKIEKGGIFEHTVDVTKSDDSRKKKRSLLDHLDVKNDESHVNGLQKGKGLCMDRCRDSSESIESSEPENFTTGLCRRKWPKRVDSTSLPSMILPHMALENPSKDSQLSFSTPLPDPFASMGKMSVRLKESDVGYMAVKNLFLVGIGKFHPENVVSGIHRCSYSSPLGNARLLAFQRHMKMTKAARGDANVQYAWHGTSAKEMAIIVMHGFGVPSRYISNEAFGVGVYLSPEYSSHTSASWSKPDDNGEKHIILCRVIMGNSEQIQAGSGQFHPSSELFDSGVDDLKNPNRYIIWSTHMNTHILPEYVVSFKSSDLPQEPWKTTGLTENSSIGSRLLFPNLFCELERFLPLSRIQELKNLYTGYKGGRINRDFLIKQVRSIAGDKVLISAIQSIRKQI